jgi:hypothetical protein
VVVNFINAVAKVEQPQLRAVLHKLSMLFALFQVQQDLGDFTSTGYLSRWAAAPRLAHPPIFTTHQFWSSRADVCTNRDQVAMLNEAVNGLLGELRKDAVPLVDAFGFSDHYLNSSLGRYNGGQPLAWLAASTRLTRKVRN